MIRGGKLTLIQGTGGPAGSGGNNREVMVYNVYEKNMLVENYKEEILRSTF